MTLVPIHRWRAICGPHQSFPNPPLRLRNADRQLWICADGSPGGAIRYRQARNGSEVTSTGGRSWVLAIKSGAEAGTTINFPACLVPRVLFHSTLISCCVSGVARGTLGSYQRLTSRRLHGPAYPPLGRPLGAGLYSLANSKNLTCASQPSRRGGICYPTNTRLLPGTLVNGLLTATR